MNSLIQYLKKVKDFRRKQGQKHPLWYILLIVILGLMTGHLGYRALGYFAKSQPGLLGQDFRNGSSKVPSYSTIRRAMMGVDWADLIEIFNQWALEFPQANEEGNWLAIDGKSLKSTLEHYRHNQQNFVSMISVFCQENGLVLTLSKIENKQESEMHRVQDIVRKFPLTNQVFTLDALHCQKKTINLICARGNDYLIAVKKINVGYTSA
jgi:DDE_Tnp_1-associated